MKNIFITGGTGFLGWEIIKNLLGEEDSTVHVLVRADSQLAADGRVNKLINERIDKEKREDAREKIKVICGDVAKKDLGIDRHELEKLYKKIDIIFHGAALCEFGVLLERIRKINLFGTKNMLDFALNCKNKGRLRSFQHISTVGIAGDSGGTLYEKDLNINQGFNNTYEQSKFEAEALVNEYRDKGLSVSVYRPSIVVGDSVTGKVSNFQMFYQPLHIFSLELVQEIPANEYLGYNLVPVDYVARAIHLISSNQDNNKNYHLTNPDTITLSSLLDVASLYFGFKKPKIIPEREYDYNRLTGFRKKVLDSYLPYFNHKKLSFDAAHSDKVLKSKDFSWPVIDEDLLLRLFKYCADVKYIKKPK